MKQTTIICRVLYLISIFLLLGQLAAAVHAADHPFHAEEDEVCKVFTALEKTSDGLLDAESPSWFRFTQANVRAKPSLTADSAEPHHYFSRAPPV